MICIPSFPYTAKIRVTVGKKAGHQLLASGDDSIGVNHSGASMFALVVGAYLILRVNSSLTISGSKTSEDIINIRLERQVNRKYTIPFPNNVPAV